MHSSTSKPKIVLVVVGVIAIAAITVYFLSYNDSPPDGTSQQDAAIADGTSDTVSGTVEQTIEDTSGDTGECNALENWFPHTDTQATDDSAFASSSNCEFHQWAWQNFLWLTQTVNGEPRFMSFVSPESLLGLEQPGMMPRMAKSNTPESFDEYLQAGTDGIFVAHDGRSVYYSQYLNDTFVDFIETNELTDPVKVQDFIASDPTTPFPVVGTVGAMELKASWMIVEEGVDTSGMFTTTTEIAKLVNQNGTIAIDPNQPETVTVALVGFHIAGVVAGHPEMIWATFEQKDNAPNVPADLSLEQPVSDQDFTFYSANTTLADCNVNYSSSNKLVLDEETQTLSPVTQVCRQYEFGNAEGVNTINDQNISMLNTSVDSLFAADDVWSNYREVGAIWFKGIDNLEPGDSLATDKLLSGSLSLSNSTIETFTQIASTENNCFRCHNTQQALPSEMGLEPLPASNLNISHAFQNIYFWSQENAQ